MTPLRPYLLRALLAWVNDNQLTPHVLVDATVPGVQVPDSAITEGRVVLNVSPLAVPDLDISDQALAFTARFSGRSSLVYLPLESITAVFCRETGVGMALPPELPDTTPAPPPEPPSPPTDPASRRAHLRVVK